MRIERLISRLVHNWPVKAMSLAAAALLFLFYRISTLEERFFSVPINVIVDEGFVPSNPYSKMARVSIRGDRDSVFQISEDDLEVYADFSSHQNEGIFKEPIQYVRRGFALDVEYFELVIEPYELILKIEEKMVREVNVVENIVGYPQKGYELGQYFLDPETVTIEGPRSHIEDIRSVYTEEIDISDASQNIDLMVPISTEDPYIRFLENSTVRFTGNIQETRITRTYNPVEIIFFDLPENVTIDSEIPQGVLKAQGTLLEIENISSGDIILSCDCSSINESRNYTLSVQPETPEGIIVLSYIPTEIEITVSVSEDA